MDGYNTGVIPPMFDMEPPPLSMSNTSLDNDSSGDNGKVKEENDDWCAFSGFVSTSGGVSQSSDQWSNFSVPPVASFSPPPLSPPDGTRDNTKDLQNAASKYSFQLETSVRQESEINEEESMFGLFYKDDSNGKGDIVDGFGEFSSDNNGFDNVYFKNDTTTSQKDDDIFYQSSDNINNESSDFGNFGTYASGGKMNEIPSTTPADINQTENTTKHNIQQTNSDFAELSENPIQVTGNMNMNSFSLEGANVSHGVEGVKSIENNPVVEAAFINEKNDDASIDNFNSINIEKVSIDADDVDHEHFSSRKESSGEFGNFNSEVGTNITIQDVTPDEYLGEVGTVKKEDQPEGATESFGDFGTFNSENETNGILIKTKSDNHFGDFITVEKEDQTPKSFDDFGAFNSENETNGILIKTKSDNHFGDFITVEKEDQTPKSFDDFGAFNSENETNGTLIKTKSDDNFDHFSTVEMEDESPESFGDFGTFNSENETNGTLIKTKSDDNFDDFSTVEKENETPESFGDFGTFNSENETNGTLIKTKSDDNFGDFSTVEKENETPESFGDFGTFNSENETNDTLIKTKSDDNFDDFSTVEKENETPESFGDFGTFNSENETNDTLIKTKSDDNFDDFSTVEKEDEAPESFGDFGTFNSENETNDTLIKTKSDNHFGDFSTVEKEGETPESFGDFGTFNSENEGNGTLIKTVDNSGGFSTIEKEDETPESFGDFGTFNSENETNDKLKQAKADDNFGDFGTVKKEDETPESFGDFSTFNTAQGNISYTSKELGFGNDNECLENNDDFGTFNNDSNTEDDSTFGAFDSAPKQQTVSPWALVSFQKTSSSDQTHKKNRESSVLLKACTEAVCSSFGTIQVQDATEAQIEAPRKRVYELFDHLRNSYQPGSELTLWDELHLIANDEDRWLMNYFTSNSFQIQIKSFSFDYKEIKTKVRLIGRLSPTLSPTASIGSFDMEVGMLVPEQTTVVSKNTLLAQSQNKRIPATLIERIPSLSSLKREDDSEPTSETTSLDLDFFMSSTTHIPPSNNKELSSTQDLLDIDLSSFGNEPTSTNNPTTTPSENFDNNVTAFIPQATNSADNEVFKSTDESYSINDFSTFANDKSTDGFGALTEATHAPFMDNETRSWSASNIQMATQATGNSDTGASLSADFGNFGQSFQSNGGEFSTNKYSAFNIICSDPPEIDDQSSNQSEITPTSSITNFEATSGDFTIPSAIDTSADKYSVFRMVDREPTSIEPESSNVCMKDEPDTLNNPAATTEFGDFSDSAALPSASVESSFSLPAFSGNEPPPSNQLLNGNLQIDFGDFSANQVSNEIDIASSSEFATFSTVESRGDKMSNSSLDQFNEFTKEPYSSHQKRNLDTSNAFSAFILTPGTPTSSTHADDFSEFASAADSESVTVKETSLFPSTTMKPQINVADKQFADFESTVVTDDSEDRERVCSAKEEPVPIIGSSENDFGDFSTTLENSTDLSHNKPTNNMSSSDFGGFADFNSATFTPPSSKITVDKQSTFGNFSTGSFTPSTDSTNKSSLDEVGNTFSISKTSNLVEKSVSATPSVSNNLTGIPTPKEFGNVIPAINPPVGFLEYSPQVNEIPAENSAAKTLFGNFSQNITTNEETTNAQSSATSTDFADFSGFSSALPSATQPNDSINTLPNVMIPQSLAPQPLAPETTLDKYSAFGALSQPSETPTSDDKYAAFGAISTNMGFSSFSDPPISISSNSIQSLHIAEVSAADNHHTNTVQSNILTSTRLSSTVNNDNKNNSVTLNTSFGELSQFTSNELPLSKDNCEFADFSSAPPPSSVPSSVPSALPPIVPPSSSVLSTFPSLFQGKPVEHFTQVSNTTTTQHFDNISALPTTNENNDNSFGDFSSGFNNSVRKTASDFAEFSSFSGEPRPTEDTLVGFADFQSVSQSNSMPPCEPSKVQFQNPHTGHIDNLQFQNQPRFHNQNYSQPITNTTGTGQFSGFDNFQHGGVPQFSNASQSFAMNVRPVSGNFQQFPAQSFQNQQHQQHHQMYRLPNNQQFTQQANMLQQQQQQQQAQQHHYQQQQQQQLRFRTNPPRNRFHQPASYHHGNDPFASLTLASNAKQLHIPVTNPSSFQAKTKKSLNDLTSKNKPS